MLRRSRSLGLPLCIAAVLLASLALGCGGGGGNRVSGTVTFKGQPVPAGKVYFLPDGSKNNSGATGYADIKDGKYDTADGGKGAVAGPVIIAVEGIDPNPPAKAESSDITTRVLFARYELEAVLPDSSSTKDITVPAEAAKGPKQPKVSKIIIP